MAKYIRGESVANATSYELHAKEAGGSTLLATKNEINFNLDELELSAGTYTLAVKAKADGYEDSDFSNEVTYTVIERGILDGITMVHGNAFLASPSSDRNRASSSVNFYCNGSKKISLKDPTKYNYALYTCTNETTQAGGVGSGWITDFRVYTDAWVGVCLKKLDETEFDFSTESNLLSDYITVE